MYPGKKYTPKDLFSIVRRYRWVIAVPLFVCLFGALLTSRFTPNRYQSDTLIRVIPQQVDAELVRPVSTVRIEDRLRSMSQQIMSRTRLEKIIADLNLYPEARQRGVMEDVVAVMRRDIEVETVIGRQDTVEAFRVRFTAGEPQTAQRVTERLASLFIEENTRDRATAANETDRFLQSQLAQASASLAEQERKVQAFRERHAGSLPDQNPANMQAVQNAQLQLQATVEAIARHRDSQMMLQRLYNDLSADATTTTRVPPRAQASEGGPDGNADPAATPAQQLEAARAALAQQEQRLKPEHPDIIRLKRNIRDLEAKVAANAAQGRPSAAPLPTTPEEESRRSRLREYRAQIESLGRQITFKEAEERNLRAQIGQYQGRLEAVPYVESELAALTRGYDALKATHNDLIEKAQQSQMAAKLTQNPFIGEQFRVVDPARLPQRPISPKRMNINMIGAALGLILGLGLAALLELRDSSLRSESDVLAALSLPVLAQVPHLETRDEVRQHRGQRALVAAAVSVCLIGSLVAAWVLQLWRYIA